MSAIRLLLADLPATLAHEVESALAGAPDVGVVGAGLAEVDLLIRAADADVVLVEAVGSQLPGVAERLVDEYPGLGVLGLDERHRGLICRLSPRLEVVDAAAPEDLVAAIRRAACGGGAPPHTSPEDRS